MTKKVFVPFWITEYDLKWITSMEDYTGHSTLRDSQLGTEITMRIGRRAHRYLDRRSFVGGSDARIIMGCDEAALIRLWREKRGETEPEDLSGNLIVHLGAATEELNRSWYERNSGRRVTDVQRRVKHSAIPWM